MLRLSLLKKILCTTLVASQIIAIAPVTKAFAMQNTSLENGIIKNCDWKLFGFEDEEELKANIIQNKDFIIDWAKIADAFGFAWCGGTNGKHVGDDFDFSRSTEDGKAVYYLNARYNANDPQANAHRSNERLQMKISNVRFVIDPSTIEFGRAKIIEEKPLIASSAYATNEGSTEDNVGMNFNYSSTVNSSKTDNFKFSEGIGVKTTFQTGIPHLFEGKVETSFSFSADQGWSNTKGESKTTSVGTQYTAKVPAKSKRLIELVSMQRKSEVPYSAKIYMEYDVTFTGFLRWSGNARKDHPDYRPTVSVTIGKKGVMSATEQLQDMYKHRNINGYSDWDWNWMIDTYNKKISQGYIERAINKVCNTNYGGILTGTFTGVDGTHIDVKAHEPEELNTSTRRKRSLDSSGIKIENFKVYDIPNVKVDSLTIDKDGVSQTIQP